MALSHYLQDKKLYLSQNHDHWKQLYSIISEKLSLLINPFINELHHIGSTAVPGVLALPIVDILLITPFVSEIEKIIHKNQWFSVKEQRVEGRKRFFLPISPDFPFIPDSIHPCKSTVGVQLFIMPLNHVDAERMVGFKTLLASNTTLQKKYTLEKQSLWNHSSFFSAPSNTDHTQETATVNTHTTLEVAHDNYEKMKIKTMYSALDHFPSALYSLVHPFSEEEWAQYHRIKKEEIFRKFTIPYDPLHPSITNPSQKHFIFYKSSRIIGIAQVEPTVQNTVKKTFDTITAEPLPSAQSNQAIVRAIAIDNKHHGKGYGSKLLKHLEACIPSQGELIICLHAHKEAVSFYEKQGYRPGAFYDPEPRVDPESVDMIKEIKTS